MENKGINRQVVAIVAKALQELKEQMIFVGGATVSLYATDIAADVVRPTDDIDLTISITDFGNRIRLNKRLAELGFHPDPMSHNICRHQYQGIPVDIIPMRDSEIGPSNPWYAIGSDDLRIVNCEGEAIQVLPPAAFLATKFEAFNNRGGDYRTSHDFEDIIYIIDNHSEIVEEVRNAKEEIRNFLIAELNKVMNHSNVNEILSAQLHPIQIEERLALIRRRIETILSS